MVILYARYSSTAQDEGDSIRRQVEGGKAWAARCGLKIDETVLDEGVSAFKGRNAMDGNLGAILQRIGTGQIEPGSTLIIESLDRLSREGISRAMPTFLSIVNAGVRVATTMDGTIYDQDSDNMVWMKALMIMARSNEESATKSSRSSSNWDKRRAAAKAGTSLLSKRLPCWLMLDGAGKIVVDKAKADAVRYVYDLALQGYGISAIVKKLNAEKLSPPSGAAMWYTRFVWRLFSEKATMGTKVVKKFEGKRRVPVADIAGYYPAVVSEDTYDRVQAMLMSRRNRTYEVDGKVKRMNGGRRTPSSHVSFFSAGLLKDEEGYSYANVYRKKVNIRYLVSMKAWAHRSGSMQYLRTELFEFAFISAFAEAWPESLRRDHQPEPSAISAKLAEIARVEQQLAEIEEQLVEGTSATAVRVLARLEAKRDQLAAEIRDERLKQSLNDYEQAEQASARLSALLGSEASDEERAEMDAIIRRYVKSATLKLTPEPGWMAGECTIFPRVGDPVAFRFSYENTKRRKVRKFASLSIEVNGVEL